MNDKTYNLRRKRHVWQKNRAYGWFLHKVKPLKLTSHQELVANSLLWDGYYKSSIRFMAPDQSLEELQNYARSLIVSGKINRMKPFWVNAWEWDSAMTEYNPFFSFGLKFLPIANAYLNCYSRYYGCRANLTRVMPKGHPQVMSQLWHRDHEDYRVMKVFLYLYLLIFVVFVAINPSYTRMVTVTVPIFSNLSHVSFFSKTCTGPAEVTYNLNTGHLHPPHLVRFLPERR